MNLARRYRPRPRARTNNIIKEMETAANASGKMKAVSLVEERASEVAWAMGVIHGGSWCVDVNHDLGFVLIVPRLSSL